MVTNWRRFARSKDGKKHSVPSVEICAAYKPLHRIANFLRTWLRLWEPFAQVFREPWRSRFVKSKARTMRPDHVYKQQKNKKMFGRNLLCMKHLLSSLSRTFSSLSRTYPVVVQGRHFSVENKDSDTSRIFAVSVPLFVVHPIAICLRFHWNQCI